MTNETITFLFPGLEDIDEAAMISDVGDLGHPVNLESSLLIEGVETQSLCRDNVAFQLL